MNAGRNYVQMNQIECKFVHGICVPYSSFALIHFYLVPFSLIGLNFPVRNYHYGLIHKSSYPYRETNETHIVPKMSLDCISWLQNEVQFRWMSGSPRNSMTFETIWRRHFAVPRFVGRFIFSPFLWLEPLVSLKLLVSVFAVVVSSCKHSGVFGCHVWAAEYKWGKHFRDSQR